MNDRADQQGSVDIDQLAAFLDGTLSPADDAAVRTILAGSTAAREVLADAIRIRDELGWEEDPNTTNQTARRWSLGRRHWLTMIPALAAAAAVVVWIGPRGERNDTGARDATLISTVSTLRPPLGSSSQPRPWTVRRGGEEALTDSELSFRAGAIWASFSLAWGSADSTADARRSQALGLLEYATTGAPIAVVQQLPHRASDAADAEGLIAASSDALGRLLEQPEFSWGEWAELMRITAAAPGGPWASAASRTPENARVRAQLRDRLSELPLEGLSDDALEAVQSLRALLADSTTAPGEVAGAIARLMQAMGG